MKLEFLSIQLQVGVNQFDLSQESFGEILGHGASSVCFKQANSKDTLYLTEDFNRFEFLKKIGVKVENVDNSIIEDDSLHDFLLNMHDKVTLFKVEELIPIEDIPLDQEFLLGHFIGDYEPVNESTKLSDKISRLRSRDDLMGSIIINDRLQRLIEAADFGQHEYLKVSNLHESTQISSDAKPANFMMRKDGSILCIDPLHVMDF